MKLNRETTKVRIVFDVSARYQGTSLNDVIEQGPTLQNSLFDVLLRFRYNRVAVCCDIQEMYLRVGIIPSDRRFHCFLWRESPSENPEVYQFNRLVFGVNASPYLAHTMTKMVRIQTHRTSQKHVEHQDATYIRKNAIFVFLVCLFMRTFGISAHNVYSSRRVQDFAFDRHNGVWEIP